jgi:glycerol-3-phosphate dehydrogenase
MNLAIALTAASKGATVGNHIEVIELLKNESGRVTGARVKDLQSGEEWNINAKVVVNATGPFVDSIRHMVKPNEKPLIDPSSGVHIVISKRYTPEGMGLIIPKTRDGRVLFLLPWEGAPLFLAAESGLWLQLQLNYDVSFCGNICKTIGSTIAGTTDSSTVITSLPRPHEEEIQFIMKEVGCDFRLGVVCNAKRHDTWLDIKISRNGSQEIRC